MKYEDFATIDGAVKAGAQECSNVPAVYFLYKNGELVYIGQSKNPINRTKSHNLSGWDEVVALPTPIEKMEEIESMMINALQPPWNRVGVDPQNRRKRNSDMRVKCTNEVSDAADLAAHRLGMTTAEYTRMALIERMARDGIHPEQPKAD
jgi:hypothetical protein